MKSSASDLPKTDPRLICVTQPEARPFLSLITHIYTDLDGTMLAPAVRC